MTERPKDWLRDFPLPVLPESWGLNPIFLEKLDELHTLFALHGYEIKLGSELEFSLESLTGAMGLELAERAIGYNRFNVPALELLDRSVWEEQKYVFEDKPFQITLDGLKQYFYKNPDARLLCWQTKLSRDEALRMVGDMESRSNSADHDIRYRAEQDIFLAYLHTTPFAQGGVRDIIEPRFGPHEFGLGWYDMAGPEIRTPIQGHAHDIIETYHKYLHVLFTQAPRFGFVLNLAMSHAPQFHISIWRKHDNKNMMLMKDDESVDFCEKALRGYCHALRAQPFLIQDTDIRADMFMKEFSASTSRLSVVRQESDNWEIRRTQLYGVTHAARHLTALIGGMAYGLFHPRAQNQSFEADMNLERRKQPVVDHRHGVHISALRSTIEHCRIGEDGFLVPEPEILKSNIDRLAAEIGPRHVNGITCQIADSDGFEYDLSYPITWEHALKEVKYQGRGFLDTSKFEGDEDAKPFRAALNSLEIKGVRTAFYCQNLPLATSFHQIAEGISGSHRCDFVHDMFMPYEQSEIAFHYKHASDDVLDRQAERVLRRYLSKLKGEDKLSHNPRLAMRAAIYEETVNPSLWHSVYHKDAMSLIERLLSIDTPVDRKIFTGAATATSSIMARFQACALGMIEESSQNFSPETLEDAENLTYICGTNLPFGELYADIYNVVQDLLSEHNINQIMQKDKGTGDDVYGHSNPLTNAVAALFIMALRNPRVSTTALKENLKNALLSITALPDASLPEGNKQPENEDIKDVELDPLSVRIYNEAKRDVCQLIDILCAWTEKQVTDETPDIPHGESCDPEELVDQRVTAMRKDFLARGMKCDISADGVASYTIE